MDLPQDLMRVHAEFKNMRKDEQINTIGLNRQVTKTGDEIRRCSGADTAPQRNATCTQKVIFDETELECIEAENVGDRLFNVLEFAFQDVAAERRRKPCSGRRCISHG